MAALNKKLSQQTTAELVEAVKILKVDSTNRSINSMKTKVILAAIAIVAIVSLSATRSKKQVAPTAQATAQASAPIGGLGAEDK